MILEQCKGVHCVDLGGSFPTHIFLQNFVLIQPRTSPPKICQNFRKICIAFSKNAFSGDVGSALRLLVGEPLGPLQRNEGKRRRCSGEQTVQFCSLCDFTSDSRWRRRSQTHPLRQQTGSFRAYIFWTLSEDRSRLARSQFLQVNTRLKALDEIYIFYIFFLCTIPDFCDFKTFAPFCKIRRNFC